MQSFFFGNMEYRESRRLAGMGKLPGMLFGILMAVVICLSGCEKSSVIYLEQENNSFAEDTLSDTETDTMVSEPADTESGRRITEKETEYLTVFVCGAVKIPGVYELPAGSRAKAAVDAAGGFREDADTEWCNLAQLLYDGQKLRIYSLRETRNLESEGFAEDDADYSSNTAGYLKASSAEEGKINLNTATKEQLMTLPGIGDARAESILSWRRQHGAFTQIEQIKEISGLKNAIFNQIKDLITVG